MTGKKAIVRSGSARINGGRKTSGAFSRSLGGENAIGFAPPKSGIDFVDARMPASAPSVEKTDAVVQPKLAAEGSREATAAPSPAAAGPTAIPKRLKSRLEGLSRVDLSDVQVHANSAKPAQLGARAYAFGNEIHLAPGQERHLPHEAWHVVQQRQGRVRPTAQFRGAPVNHHPGLEREADVMGERAARGVESVAGRNGFGATLGAAKARPAASSGNVVQGYFEESYVSGTWLQADDMSVATEKGYPNHKLYARAGKVAAANIKLAAVNSGVELVETGTTEKFWEGSRISPTRQASLKKIEAKNKQNNTQGDDMLLYADCGKSEAVISGSEDRQAVYDKPGGPAGSKAPGGPRAMKTAIMKAWLEHEQADLDVLLALLKATTKESDLDAINAEYNLATTKTDKDKIVERYKAKLEEITEEYWKYYNTQSATERDRIDGILKINRYATPDVGQGYTISSGGASAGKSTWNFHWGGVVMTSDDGHDKVVLENYAVGDPKVENKLWTFDLYGTQKKDQTFHERHFATQQHGLTPTTMTIEKK